MAYTDNKAPGRVSPNSDRVSAAPAPASRSNQMKAQGQSSKFRTPSLAPKAQVGNQVRMAGNSKGTGVAGRPSAVALAGKTSSKGAVENPSK